MCIMSPPTIFEWKGIFNSMCCVQRNMQKISAQFEMGKYMLEYMLHYNVEVLAGTLLSFFARKRKIAWKWMYQQGLQVGRVLVTPDSSMKILILTPTLTPFRPSLARASH